ncbi:MAG: hypothetical protein M9894_13520 [Planctomycetes bacterium]|nr:hypothetical protein [Planctomycetota bacterium]
MVDGAPQPDDPPGPPDRERADRLAAARARRVAARKRREAERAARQPAAPPAPEQDAPGWLWPALVLLVLLTLAGVVLRAREERAAHDGTRAALADERAGRFDDARAAQERALDAADEASRLRADLDAARLEVEATLAAATAAVESLTAALSAAEANRAALQAELQRVGAELAAARLAAEDGAQARDQEARARGLAEQERDALERALALADTHAAGLRAGQAELERERDRLRAQTDELARARDEARARAVVAEGALERARPTRTALPLDVASVTSSTPVVVRVADGRVAGPAIQAALEAHSAVAVAVRLGDPALAGRLRLQARVQGEPVSELAASPGVGPGEHARFWLDRAAAARCARGFARDGFLLVLSLAPDPARTDEAAEVLALELVVAPLGPDAAARLRALDRGEDAPVESGR